MGALITPALVPVVAHATPSNMESNIKADECGGSNTNLNTSGSATPCKADSGDLNTLLTHIINIFSVLVGAIAVIMIVIGGFRYVISSGNDQAVSGAKNTIIFALVGLVIVALAQFIVHFVIGNLP
jgi:hypothetical protein